MSLFLDSEPLARSGAEGSQGTLPLMKCAKRDDLPKSESSIHSGPVKLDNLTGTWINTYRATGSIVKFMLRRNDDAGYAIETFLSGEDSNLGAVPVQPFSASVDSVTADGFTGRYDLGFCEILLSAYYVKGLIVVSQYTTFRDQSGRPNYFNREFFFREV